MSAVRQTTSSDMWPETARSRVLLIVFVLLLWMIAVAARLVYLQAYQHDWLKDRAAAQQQGSFKASPLRGLITDRKGRELARSIEAESFFAVPNEIGDIDATIKKVSSVIDIDKKELYERLKTAQEKGSKFEWIVRKVDNGKAVKLNSMALAGIHSYKEPKRHYPNNELAGDVLGFVNIDDEGIAGLELAQNEKLQGETTKVLVETDASRKVYQSVAVSGRSGQTLVLTIDQMIQFYAQQAIAAAVERTKAKSGTVVILDPKTGEILALANAPTYNPNSPFGTSSEAKDNDALQTSYEPGSTFKLITYSAAMEEGIATPDEEIFCENGSYTFSGRTIRDSHSYGTLTFTQAFAKSSNIAAIKLGQRLGNEKFYGYIKKFGFGTKTGVELPYEADGLLRPPLKWSKTTIGSIPMGHEIGVTPVQIASAYGTIANNGIRISPHLIKEVRDENGYVVFSASPAQSQVVKTETAKTIQKLLTGVVEGGTGKLAQLSNYTSAGKTGTAQKIDPKTRRYSQTNYVASFVGVAPVNNPAIVIAVMLDEPVGAHTGGAVSAPVFREIAEKVLPELNIAPDLEGQKRNPVSGNNETKEEDFEEETGGSDLGGEEKNISGKKENREEQTEKVTAANKNEKIATTEPTPSGKKQDVQKSVDKKLSRSPDARGPDSGKEKRNIKPKS